MNKKIDIYISVLLLIFCGVAISQISQLPKGANTEFGLGFFPTIMTTVLAILSLILLIKGYKSNKVSSQKVEKLDKKSVVRVLTMIILMIGYILTYERFGFIVSTIAFTLVTMLILKEKKKIFLIGMPLIITAVIYLGFTEILHVVLP